jgi:hypothetical protein
MEINKKYEITFPNGSTTTVVLVSIKINNGQHYLFQYLDGETRKPVTPNKDTDDGKLNRFYFPEMYLKLTKYKEI